MSEDASLAAVGGIPAPGDVQSAPSATEAGPTLHSTLILAYLVHSAYVETAACLGAVAGAEEAGDLGARTHHHPAAAATTAGAAPAPMLLDGDGNGVPPGRATGVSDRPSLLERSGGGGGSQPPAHDGTSLRGGLVGEGPSGAGKALATGAGAGRDPLAHILHGPLASIHARHHITRLVLEGNASGALEALHAHFGQGLLADPRAQEALFALECQRFIELVRTGSRGEEALAFANAELGRFVQPAPSRDSGSPGARTNPKHIQRLADLVSLIAYADPAASPVSHYLSQEQRERTAQTLNSFILSYLGPFPGTSSLEMLVRQLTVVSQELSPATAASLPTATATATTMLPRSAPGTDVLMGEASGNAGAGGTTTLSAGPSFAELTTTLSAHWSLSQFVGPDAYQRHAKIESLYLGGRVLEGADGCSLFSACGNDVVWTSKTTGQVVRRLESEDTVATFVVTPDQKFLLSSHINSLLVKIWDISVPAPASAEAASPTDTPKGNPTRPTPEPATRTSEPLYAWKAHEAPVLSMELHASGTLLATGSADSTIKLWDLSRRAGPAPAVLTHHLKGHGGIISALAFHPAALLLASGSEDCKVRLWSLESSSCVHLLDSHASIVTALAFTPAPGAGSSDRMWLATGARDQIVNVWEVPEQHVAPSAGTSKRKKKAKPAASAASMATLAPLHSHYVQGSVEVMGWLPAALFPELRGSEHAVLYTGGPQGLQLWQVGAEEGLALLPRVLAAPVESAQTPKGQAADNTAAASPPLSTLVTQAQFLPARAELLLATADQTLSYRSIPTLTPTGHQISGYNQEVLGLALLGAECESHLALVSNSPDLKVYDVRAGGALRCTILPAHQDTILCCASNRKGAGPGAGWLVTGSKDTTIRLWWWQEGGEANSEGKGDGLPPFTVRCVGVGRGHTGPVSAVAVCSKYLLSASHDRTIKRWELPALDEVVGASEPVKLAATFTFQAHEKDVQSVAIAPNERLFASGSLDRMAKVWAAQDGRLLGTCKGHRRGIWSVAFSPVAQVLATASTDKTIKLWSLADYSCIRTLEGHLNTVLAVSFLAGGGQLVSAGSDGLCKLWNTKTSECMATLDEHEDRVWCLALSRDDGLLVTGSADSTVCLCRDMTEALEQEGEREKQLLLSRQQDLSLYVAKRDYKNAILLALELDQPLRLLKLFQDVMLLAEAGSTTGSLEVDRVVAELSDVQITGLLTHLRAWNTQARYALVSQALLHVLLKAKGASGLLALPNAGKGLIEPLLAYTQRHFDHASELLQASFLLDFALFSMAE